MLKIAIVDDDSRYLDDFMENMERYQKEESVEIDVFSFNNGLEFISDFKPVYDILFLDIEMPHMSGIELAKIVRKSDPNALIIFITNMPQYAVKGYEVNAFDYVMKPIEYFSFSIKLKSAIAVIDSGNETTLTIPWEDGSRNIKTSEILYIEVQNHWLHIHTKEYEYKMLGTLKEMEEQLAVYNFIRSNKCYLVNLQHVIHLRSDTVTLIGNHKLKISRARRKEVQNAFIDYYSEQRM